MDFEWIYEWMTEHYLKDKVIMDIQAESPLEA